MVNTIFIFVIFEFILFLLKLQNLSYLNKKNDNKNKILYFFSYIFIISIRLIIYIINTC